MATRKEFVDFVCNQISEIENVRYIKMMGEYLLYVDDKPTFLICDNMVYIKMLPCVEGLMDMKGIPYKGAKEHYILDIEDREFSCKVARLVANNTQIPKKRKR